MQLASGRTHKLEAGRTPVFNQRTVGELTAAAAAVFMIIMPPFIFTREHLERMVGRGSAEIQKVGPRSAVTMKTQ